MGCHRQPLMITSLCPRSFCGKAHVIDEGTETDHMVRGKEELDPESVVWSPHYSPLGALT